MKTDLNRFYYRHKKAHLLLFFIVLSFQSIGVIPKTQRILIDNLIAEKAYHDALTLIAELNSLYPRNAELQLLKGKCYLYLPKYSDQAIPTIQQSLAYKPEQALRLEILFNLASAQFSKQMYNESIVNYTELKSTIPAAFKEFTKQIDEKILFARRALLPDSIPFEETITVTPSSTVTIIKPPSLSTETMGTTEEIESSVIPSNFVYTIQIFALKFPLANQYFKNNKDISYLKKENLYKYFYSKFSTITQARDAFDKVKQEYPQAYITRLTDEQASKLTVIPN